MTKTMGTINSLIEKEQAIAAYDKRPVHFSAGKVSYYDHDGEYPTKYAESFDWIIPVWSRLYREVGLNIFMNVYADQENRSALLAEYSGYHQTFHLMIDSENTAGAFKVLYNLLRWHNVLLATAEKRKAEDAARH